MSICFVSCKSLSELCKLFFGCIDTLGCCCDTVALGWMIPPVSGVSIPFHLQVKLSQLTLASTGRYRCEVILQRFLVLKSHIFRSAKRDHSLQRIQSLATCS